MKEKNKILKGFQKLRFKTTAFFLGASLLSTSFTSLFPTMKAYAMEKDSMEASLEKKSKVILAGSSEQSLRSDVEAPQHIIINIITLPNLDGTYTEIVTKQNPDTLEIEEEKTVKPCEFGQWVYQKETNQDIRTCSITGYQEVREHVHQNVLFNRDDVYEYQKCLVCNEISKVPHHYMVNTFLDGTTILTCKHCGNNFDFLKADMNQVYQNALLQGIQTVHTPFTYENKVFLKSDAYFEYWKDTATNEIFSVAHQLEVSQSENTTLSKCLNPSCGYQKSASNTHQHTGTTFVSKNEMNDVLTCELCHEPYEDSHDYEFRVNPDQSVQLICTKCNHSLDVEQVRNGNLNSNEQKLVPSKGSGGGSGRGGGGSSGGGGGSGSSHKHTHNYTVLTQVDDTYEYWSCEKDGDVTKIPHQFATQETDKEIITYCKNKGCTYRKVDFKEIHDYNRYLGNSGNQEVWGCATCDKTVFKDHNLGPKQIDRDTFEEYQKCETPGCDYEIRKEHEHDYSILLHCDGVTEERECSGCGKKKTIEHIHQLGKETIDRETHEVVKKCETAGCNYEERKEHEHNFSKFVSCDGTNEVYECPDCGKTNTILHEHKLGETYQEDVTYDYLRDCETPGCEYVERTPHSTKHEYHLDSYDEYSETMKCVCGNSYTRGHTWNEGTRLESGEYYQECETCDATRNYHDHIVGDREYVPLKNEEGCYKYIYNCKICGEYVTEDPPVQHVWDEEDGIKQCIRCRYTVYTNQASEINNIELMQDIPLEDEVIIDEDDFEIEELEEDVTETFTEKEDIKEPEEKEIEEKMEEPEDSSNDFIEVEEDEIIPEDDDFEIEDWNQDTESLEEEDDFLIEDFEEEFEAEVSEEDNEDEIIFEEWDLEEEQQENAKEELKEILEMVLFEKETRKQTSTLVLEKERKGM